MKFIINEEYSLNKDINIFMLYKNNIDKWILNKYLLMIENIEKKIDIETICVDCDIFNQYAKIFKIDRLPSIIIAKNLEEYVVLNNATTEELFKTIDIYDVRRKL